MMMGGQKQMAALGYSPLPINLVKGGLDQVDKIYGAVPTPDRNSLAGCNNPTFQNGKNTLQEWQALLHNANVHFQFQF